MPDEFQAFFSYAHADAKLDPELFRAFSEQLAARVNTKLVNAKLAVWRDINKLETGDRWDNEIKAALKDSHFLIVMLSPNWLDSQYCRDEFETFRKLEPEPKTFVIPLLVHGVEKQREFLDAQQRAVFDALMKRQFKPALAGAYLQMTDKQLSALVDDVATHVATKIDAIRRTKGGAANGAASKVNDASFDPPPTHDITRIFDYAPGALIGREAETLRIDDAWAAAMRGEAKRARIVAFVAMGGEGKTALVADWAVRKQVDGWLDCDRAFAWSFYSQGTRDQYAGDSDLFIAEALAFFGGETKPGEGAVEKAKRVAKLIGDRRSLLILDGLEPLQYPSGPPHDGALKDDAMAALLKALATFGKALVLVTTRVPIVELKASALLAATPQHDLTRLSTPAGVALLKALGVKGSQKNYEGLVEETQGHALTLTFLGSYLKRVHRGDIHRFDRVEWDKASKLHKNNHAFRAMATYEKFLSQGDAGGAREIAILRLMGLFDRPADAGCLKALLGEKIDGLNEALVEAGEDEFNLALDNLESEKLLTVSRDPGGALVALDAHPLLREYFATELREKNPEGWKAAHRRLYEHLCRAETDKKPAPTLDDLRPLYQAVAHGCHAGLHEEARAKVYRDRILRGTGSDGFYSTNKLGAFGADLGAVACFFDAPWTRLSPHLSPPVQAWLLAVASFDLRALGRLQEALEPMRAGLVMRVEQENWTNAAISASNISELALALGDVAAAVEDGAASVAHAERSGEAVQRMIRRTTHADALHQQGAAAAARALFETAEAMQKERQPRYTLLYSVQGFRYCDLLLAPAERAAWRVLLAVGVFPLPHPEERASARVSKDEGEENIAHLTSSSFETASSRPPQDEDFETRRMRVAPQDEDFETPAPQAPQDEDVLGAMDRASPDAQTVPPSLRGGEADEAIQSRTRGSGLLRFARNDDREALRADCDAVARRAGQTLQWTDGKLGRLTIALDHLTRACAALYAAILRGRAPDGVEPVAPDGAHIDAAVNGLRDAGAKHHQPRGLLTRALCRAVTGDFPGAQEDLDEAFDIAERGPMRLHLADIHLHRARLFGLTANRPVDYPWLSPADDLAKARALIEACGYGRRKEELEDAEAALSLLP